MKYPPTPRLTPRKVRTIPRSNPYGYGNALIPIIGSLLGQRFASSGTQTTTQDRVNSGLGVTNQMDRKLIYRKKKMPYRKKKRWLKFNRKVKATELKTIGTKSVLNNDQLSSSATTNALQIITTAMYGINGASDTGSRAGHRDIFDIFDADTLDIQQNATTGAPEQGKVMFISAIFDLTMENTSPNDTGQNTKLEVDVYEMIHKKDTRSQGTMFDFLNDGLAITPNIGSGTGIAINDRGFTPFESPIGLRKYGITIVKKTKYFLGTGEVATLQVRDPRNHVISAERINDIGTAMRGLTRHVFIAFKPTPGYTTGNVARLTVGVTRAYKYKVLKNNISYDVAQ